ncbi:phage tail protein I [Vibrio sp. PP-XX7]
MNHSAVLPPNATGAERAIVDAITPDLPVTIRDLWDPETCPADFLPYLAQSFSVDRWDMSWSESKNAA